MSDVLIQTWRKTKQSRDEWHRVTLHFVTRTHADGGCLRKCWRGVTPQSFLCVWWWEKATEGARVIPTFFRSFPLMWQSRLVPSKHIASRRPFPNILITWAYSETQESKGSLNQPVIYSPVIKGSYTVQNRRNKPLWIYFSCLGANESDRCTGWDNKTTPIKGWQVVPTDCSLFLSSDWFFSSFAFS